MSKHSNKVHHGNYSRNRRWLLKNALTSIPLWTIGASVATSLGSCACHSRSRDDESAANEVLEWTASEAINRIRSGSITAEHYVSQLLKRHRECKALNVMAWIDEDRVLERARSVDFARSKRQALGPLAGLPLVIKDNINTVGFPTTAGTPTLKGFYPRSNAPVADILFRNGAILLGKTNMPELARGITSSSPEFGFTRNPYDLNRAPGGSSSGTAAAISARITPAGLGTDTGGSTRIPAAFCGIVGFRPSTGGPRKAWTDDGVVPIARSVDTPGPMGRTVSDVALLNAIVTGSALATALPLRDVRIGVPRGFYWEDLDSEVVRVSERALAKLRNVGAILVDVDSRHWAQAADATFLTLSAMHSVQDLREFLARNVPDVSLDQVIAGVVSKNIRAMFRDEMAHPVSSQRAEEASKMLRPRLVRQYEELFRANDISAIVYPTVPVLAPKIRSQGDAPEDTIEVNGKQLNEFGEIVRNTHLSGVAGTPSLTIPAGLSSFGVPVGLSFEALVAGDRRLLGLGLSLEAALGRLPGPILRNSA
jgi:indoleacetamide hydrolase